MTDEEAKAMFFKKFNVCISNKDLEKAFKNKNLVDTLVDKAIETQYKDNELKVLQKIIEKQQKEIEELKYKVREHICIEAHEQVKQCYISKDKIKAKIEDILNSENSEAIQKLIEWQSLLEME